MIKSVLFITSVIFTLNSVAGEAWEFTCSTDPNGFNSSSFNVRANVSGEIQKTNEKYSIHYDVSYEIKDLMCRGAKKECTWSQMKFEGKAENNINYKPRRYKDYAQFDIGLQSSVDLKNYGTFQILFPKFKDETYLPATFKAYLIMTNVLDHFGATVPVECSY